MRFLLAVVLCFVSVAARGDTNIYARRVVISSAQQDAEAMARTGILRHCGRNGGQVEGIGCGPTPEAARRNCCFFGQRQIVEEGVAYSPVRRQWFAVIRYR
jgi:hypothetical protein